MKFPMIAILATAATLFAASLANAEPAPRRGHNAYGSAAPVADAWPNEQDAVRASALRECNKEVANMYDYAWGVQLSNRYRACMAANGQME